MAQAEWNRGRPAASVECSGGFYFVLGPGREEAVPVPMSGYLKGLRSRVGTDLLLLPSVAAIVRDREGRVLLQRRSDNGGWSLPAGSIEPSEAPAQAVVREVWEETGLVVTPERLVGAFGGQDYRYAYPNGDQVELTVLLFACTVTGGSLSPHDDESVDLRYFRPDDMPPLGLPYPARIFQAETVERVVFQWDPAWLEGLN